MEIRLTPEQSSQFANLAAFEGRKVEELTNEALNRYLSEEARYIAAVKLGEEALDRGERLTHEDVGAHLAQWLKR
jgi:predicted transcriptional regulator